MWPNKDEKKPDPPIDPNARPPEPVKIEDIVASVEASIKAAMGPLQAQVQGLTTEFNSLKEAARPKPPPKETEEPDFYEDPAAAINKMLAPRDAALVLTRAELTEQKIKREFSGWDEYEGEINKVLEDTPLGIKAQANYGEYVRNAIAMIVGKHAMQGGLKRKGEKFFIEDASTTGPQNAPQNEDEAILHVPVTLPDGKTTTRAQIAAKWGMKPEEYLKSMKQLEVVT